MPAWALLAAVACGGASAQGLPDPTRPPAGFIDPADFAGLPRADSSGREREAPAARGLVLQSVLLPSQGKAVAVISGHYVPVGANVAGWELREVRQSEVVLGRAGDRRVLSLTPLVKKIEAKPPSDAAKKTVTGKKNRKPRKAS